jgi:hypothetical protein
MPGVGLLLLRTAVGATTLAQGGAYLAGGNALVNWVVGTLAITSGAALFIGFLTPVAALLVSLGAAALALSWLPTPIPAVLGDRLGTVLLMIVATAVALLGPGGCSLDSFLFGRREIVIPHDSRSPKH